MFALALPSRSPAARRAVEPVAARGLTLVEVVLTMAIIAIISAIAVPRYAGAASRYRVEAACRRIVYDLQTAQTRAVATSTAITVSFDTLAAAYTASYPDPEQPAKNYTVDLTRDPYAAQIVSAVFGNANSFTFNGYGLPSAGGTVVVKSGTSTGTLTIDPDTGAVTYTLQ